MSEFSFVRIGYLVVACACAVAQATEIVSLPFSLDTNLLSEASVGISEVFPTTTLGIITRTSESTSAVFSLNTNGIGWNISEGVSDFFAVNTKDGNPVVTPSTTSLGGPVTVSWTVFTGDADIILLRGGVETGYRHRNISGMGSYVFDTGSDTFAWEIRGDYGVRIRPLNNPGVYADSTAFSLTAPGDLQVTAVPAGSYSSGQAGVSIPVTVTHSGPNLVRGAYVTAGLFWSRTGKLDGSEKSLWQSVNQEPYNFANADLNASGSNTVSATANIPQTPNGTYYVIATVDLANGDSYHPESDETNNVSVYPVTVGGPSPDLVVENLTATPAAGLAGSRTKLAFKVHNQGAGSANASQTRIYLGTSPTGPQSGDPLLLTASTPALKPGATVAYSLQVTIPKNTPAGTCKVWVVADATKSAGQTGPNYANDAASMGFTVNAASGAPIIAVAPQKVSFSATPTTGALIKITNTGSGTLAWNAAVTSGAAWIHITSATSGTGNSATIVLNCDPNTSPNARTGNIQITATGTSPVNVPVEQAGQSKSLIFYIDENGDNQISSNEVKKGVEVYFNGIPAGKTDTDGKISATNVRWGDAIFGRYRVQTYPAVKERPTPNKNLLSIYMDSDTMLLGSDSDPTGEYHHATFNGAPVQYVQLGHPVLEWDLLVAFECDPKDTLQKWQQAFQDASKYIYDASDGQIRLGSIQMVTNCARTDSSWNNADVKIFNEFDKSMLTKEKLDEDVQAFTKYGVRGGVPAFLPGSSLDPSPAIFISRKKIQHPDIAVTHEFFHYSFLIQDEYIDGNGSKGLWLLWRLANTTKLDQWLSRQIGKRRRARLAS